MRLSRTIERGLRDGASVVVERVWQVEFAHQGRGIAIIGDQVLAQVQAPTELQRLAEIEQARSTAGMFPIMLSATGEIMKIGEAIAKVDLEAAIREAEAIIANRGDSASRKAERRAYLAQLQRASGTMLEQMPRDLFYPKDAEAHSVRPVNLPDGSIGEFEFTYVASRTPGYDWLERAERQIVTRIQGDERKASEIWTLSKG